MLSIVMLARNVPRSAANCITSLLSSVAKLGMESEVEYVFVDDASDAGKEVAPLMVQARGQTKSPVRVLRFVARQHYTRALATAFSVIHGQAILFVSHDMIVTPSYIRTLLDVGRLDPSIGIVRGTSTYVDCFREHIIMPPMPIRGVNDIFDFSEYVARYYGLKWEEDPSLVGDSMLIQPAVLQKVGVFDPRYFGYFGDADYGLRVQRAGFKLVCAKGAWLLHEGAAYYKDEAAGKEMQATHAARMQVVNEAYGVFRNKWSLSLPVKYPGNDLIDYQGLLKVPPPPGGDYQAKVMPDATVCQML